MVIRLQQKANFHFKKDHIQRHLDVRGFRRTFAHLKSVEKLIQNILSYTKLLIFFVVAVTITSCATEFEKVRTSADPKLILAKAHEYYQDEDYGNAQALYELAIQYYRGKEEAEDIFFNFAYTHYHLEEFITAAHYFKSFSTTFYNSKNKEEAEFMAAYSNYRLSPNFRLDQSYSKKAAEGFQNFINNNPKSERVEECNALIDKIRDKMEEKSFNQGKLYYDIKQYQSAVQSFQNTLKDYPGAKREEETKYLLVKASMELAENSVVEKREERYETVAKYAAKYGPQLKNRSFKKEVESILQSARTKIKNDKV